MIRFQIMRLLSREYPGGPLLYPDVQKICWARLCPGVWFCVGMERQ